MNISALQQCFGSGSEWIRKRFASWIRIPNRTMWIRQDCQILPFLKHLSIHCAEYKEGRSLDSDSFSYFGTVLDPDPHSICLLKPYPDGTSFLTKLNESVRAFFQDKSQLSHPIILRWKSKTVLSWRSLDLDPHWILIQSGSPVWRIWANSRLGRVSWCAWNGDTWVSRLSRGPRCPAGSSSLDYPPPEYRNQMRTLSSGTAVLRIWPHWIDGIRIQLWTHRRYGSTSPSRTYWKIRLPLPRVGEYWPTLFGWKLSR